MFWHSVEWVVHNIAKDCNAFMLRVKQSWKVLNSSKTWNSFTKNTPLCRSIESQWNLLGNFVNYIRFCFSRGHILSAGEWDCECSGALQFTRIWHSVLTYPVYKTTPSSLLQFSGRSIYRKYLTFKNPVINFVISGSNAQWPTLTKGVTNRHYCNVPGI